MAKHKNVKKNKHFLTVWNISEYMLTFSVGISQDTAYLLDFSVQSVVSENNCVANKQTGIRGQQT